MLTPKQEIKELVKKIEIEKQRKRNDANTLIFMRRHARIEASRKFIDDLLLSRGLHRDDDNFLI
jgi:hypothetical protein